ncbi:hypothetical protein LPY66_07710 [Dehalobacter sp. DCM]|uniref:hypothetical protein n=1 Tax=Dehalobacter sp. DCM TaxID=2907827 RepID=UPI0030821AC3|nr:hypothetical protein LPY66_07710 [Dehalobacter sp. DCM]
MLFDAGRVLRTTPMVLRARGLLDNRSSKWVTDVFLINYWKRPAQATPDRNAGQKTGAHGKAPSFSVHV